MAQRLTRHNGRANKNGVYKADHNDRRFDLENADHIDSEMTKFNVYWDCFSQMPLRGDQVTEAPSFAEVEKLFYSDRFADHILGQHERNAKARHPERDRSAEDILADKRFCPEETIYQIGTIEDHADPGTLLSVANEFLEELDRRFGDHVHVLNWALHVDEGTPHIHERHVFDYTNRYGEIQPGQDKALEALGFEPPDPTKKPGKHNSRKMVFDATCRTILFDICKKHGLHLEEEPAYGGRAYLEKQDYILMQQKEQLLRQQEDLEAVTGELAAASVRLEDTEALLDQVAEVAYEKAVEIVTDTVRAETQDHDLKIVNDFQEKAVARNRAKPNVVELSTAIMTDLKAKLKATALTVTKRITERLQDPKVKQTGKEAIKNSARRSIHELLANAQAKADDYNASRSRPTRKKNTDLDR